MHRIKVNAWNESISVTIFNGINAWQPCYGWDQFIKRMKLTQKFAPPKHFKNAFATIRILKMKISVNHKSALWNAFYFIILYIYIWYIMWELLSAYSITFDPWQKAAFAATELNTWYFSYTNISSDAIQEWHYSNQFFFSFHFHSLTPPFLHCHSSLASVSFSSMGFFFGLLSAISIIKSGCSGRKSCQCAIEWWLYASFVYTPDIWIQAHFDA